MLVQAALSIFWSVLAMCIMTVAARLKLRAPWMTGAALMGVVVVELLLVDLSNVGGVELIVSFIGVGLLMLLIGYVSPVPPRIQNKPSEQLPGLLCMLASLAAAAEEDPDEFAYSVTLELAATARCISSRFRPVYEGVAHADLADVPVFNGRGEIVPHASKPPGARSAPLPGSSCPFFRCVVDPTRRPDLDIGAERRPREPSSE